jgi:hypothetical protein
VKRHIRPTLVASFQAWSALALAMMVVPRDRRKQYYRNMWELLLQHMGRHEHNRWLLSPQRTRCVGRTKVHFLLRFQGAQVMTQTRNQLYRKSA